MRFALAALLAALASAQTTTVLDTNENSYKEGVDDTLDHEYDPNVREGNIYTKKEPADFFDGDDWNPMSLDGIEEATHSWFQEKALPFYNVHKAGILQKAMDAAEAEHGKLLGTCAKGQACQQEKKRILVDNLESRWKQVITQFQQEVKDAVLFTEDKIEDTYAAYVECADENPCCTTPGVVIDNFYIQLENYYTGIWRRRVAIKELQAKIDEIEHECPEVKDKDIPKDGRCFHTDGIFGMPLFDKHLTGWTNPVECASVAENRGSAYFAVADGSCYGGDAEQIEKLWSDDYGVYRSTDAGHDENCDPNHTNGLAQIVYKTADWDDSFMPA